MANKNKRAGERKPKGEGQKTATGGQKPRKGSAQKTLPPHKQPAKKKTPAEGSTPSKDKPVPTAVEKAHERADAMGSETKGSEAEAGSSSTVAGKIGPGGAEKEASETGGEGGVQAPCPPLSSEQTKTFQLLGHAVGTGTLVCIPAKDRSSGETRAIACQVIETDDQGRFLMPLAVLIEDTKRTLTEELDTGHSVGEIPAQPTPAIVVPNGEPA